MILPDPTRREGDAASWARFLADEMGWSDRDALHRRFLRVAAGVLTAYAAEQVAQARAEEREAVMAIIRQFLVFDSQRAISWHEVQDCLAAIRRRGEG